MFFAAGWRFCVFASRRAGRSELCGQMVDCNICDFLLVVGRLTEAGCGCACRKTSEIGALADRPETERARDDQRGAREESKKDEVNRLKEQLAAMVKQAEEEKMGRLEEKRGRLAAEERAKEIAVFRTIGQQSQFYFVLRTDGFGSCRSVVRCSSGPVPTPTLHVGRVREVFPRFRNGQGPVDGQGEESPRSRSRLRQGGMPVGVLQVRFRRGRLPFSSPFLRCLCVSVSCRCSSLPCRTF
jgi:hypothetical protein